MVFDGEHQPLATFPGMRDRTVTISSLGKTFSCTGWKIGWACAPAELVSAIRTVKQFLTFSGGAPFQVAGAAALALPDDVFAGVAKDLRVKRDLLAAGLRAAGYEVLPTAGTYFLNVDIRSMGETDGLAFCRALPERRGVAAVPDSVFYEDPRAGRTPGALRLLQAHRGPRGGRPAADGAGMKVAVVQHDICFGDAAATIARLRPRVAEAAAVRGPSGRPHRDVRARVLHGHRGGGRARGRPQRHVPDRRRRRARRLDVRLRPDPPPAVRPEPSRSTGSSSPVPTGRPSPTTRSIPSATRASTSTTPPGGRWCTPTSPEYA